MNEPTHTPLNEPERDPSTVDELISAALDGLLDEAAADLGVPHAEAHSLVERHPERSSILRSAGALIAAPPPLLDEVTRRRLVAAALSASASPAASTARRRRLVAVAGIAAAVAMVAGIGAVLVGGPGDRDGGGDDIAAEGAASSGSTLALGPSADLGEVSDPSVLRDRLEQELLAPRGEASDDGVAESSAPVDTESGGPVESEASSRAGDGVPVPTGAEGFDAAGDAGADDGSGDAGTLEGVDCATFLAADFEDVGTPLLVASATFEGEPAGVLVISGDDARLAVVYSTQECTILATQSSATP